MKVRASIHQRCERRVRGCVPARGRARDQISIGSFRARRAVMCPRRDVRYLSPFDFAARAHWNYFLVLDPSAREEPVCVGCTESECISVELQALRSSCPSCVQTIGACCDEEPTGGNGRSTQRIISCACVFVPWYARMRCVTERTERKGARGRTPNRLFYICLITGS